jgi:hypothetical protein
MEFLLHDSQEILTSDDVQGGTHIQTLHAKIAFVCHDPEESFVTRFTHVPFCHCTSNINNHMVKTGDFIIN